MKLRTIAAFYSLDSDLTNDMFINSLFFLFLIRENGEILCVQFLLLGRYKHINSMNGRMAQRCYSALKSEAYENNKLFIEASDFFLGFVCN